MMNNMNALTTLYTVEAKKCMLWSRMILVRAQALEVEARMLLEAGELTREKLNHVTNEADTLDKLMRGTESYLDTLTTFYKEGNETELRVLILANPMEQVIITMQQGV